MIGINLTLLILPIQCITYGWFCGKSTRLISVKLKFVDITNESEHSWTKKKIQILIPISYRKAAAPVHTNQVHRIQEAEIQLIIIQQNHRNVHLITIQNRKRSSDYARSLFNIKYWIEVERNWISEFMVNYSMNTEVKCIYIKVL